MTSRTQSAALALPQDGAVGPALVLASVVSVQVGAAVAKGLFPTVGAAGTVLLRLTVGAAKFTGGVSGLTVPVAALAVRGTPGSLVAVSTT